MSSILEKIVRHKLVEIDQNKRGKPIQELQASVKDLAPALDFVGALKLGHPHRVSLIAEVKKASPSKGIIREDFDPVAIAVAYSDNGASCISVLTDEEFFQGSLQYLKQIRRKVDLPLLRKDFILDEYQIWEARAAGADAVLLIAECLEPKQMKRLHQLITELGMTALVELYDSRNIDAVLDCDPELIGVNNRNLNTFEIDLNHSVRVKQDLPSSITMVSESGIFTHQDILLMQQNEIDAVLVGESLMRSNDIGLAVRELMEG